MEIRPSTVDIRYEYGKNTPVNHRPGLQWNTIKTRPLTTKYGAETTVYGELTWHLQWSVIFHQGYFDYSHSISSCYLIRLFYLFSFGQFMLFHLVILSILIDSFHLVILFILIRLHYVILFGYFVSSRMVSLSGLIRLLCLFSFGNFLCSLLDTSE
jgi:hypothetical protein